MACLVTNAAILTILSVFLNVAGTAFACTTGQCKVFWLMVLRFMQFPLFILFYDSDSFFFFFSLGASMSFEFELYRDWLFLQLQVQCASDGDCAAGLYCSSCLDVEDRRCVRADTTNQFQLLVIIKFFAIPDVSCQLIFMIPRGEKNLCRCVMQPLHHV